MLLRFEALTDDDKAKIKQMCADADIKTSFNKRCKDCYKDALLLLKLHYGVTAPDADIVTPSGHFVYHNGMKKVVWWWRHNYYELSSQSDDETIEKYMAVHPSHTHFSRVEPEPTETTSTVGDNGTESGENTENNEGVNAEGDNDGKEQTDETNS